MKRKLLIRAVAASLAISVPLLLVEGFLRRQSFVELDHFAAKFPGNNLLHHGADKFVISEHGPCDSAERTKILLLGDSWMEDEHLSKSIADELANTSGRCVQAVNGGTSSYAPTLYLLKAQQAAERYGKFDHIVVNIDETDIGDEWVRYRIPTRRDKTGRIVAVPFNRDVHSMYLWNGKLWAEASDLYIIRFAKFAFFHKVLAPMLYKFTYCPDYSCLMRYVSALDARTVFKTEHKHFEDRVLEMTAELSQLTGGAGSVYLTHHPHRRGLASDTEEGNHHLPIASEVLGRVGSQSGVTVLDAREHITQIHGKELPNGTYKPGDPFSHLSADGAGRYGRWIGSQIN